jgi:hypothetical protein
MEGAPDTGLVPCGQPSPPGHAWAEAQLLRQVLPLDASRVDQLEIGTAHAAGDPTADPLVAALRRVFNSQVSKTSHALADRVRIDGD